MAPKSHEDTTRSSTSGTDARYADGAATSQERSARDAAAVTAPDRDPFLYYSDDQIRLKWLRMDGVTDADEAERRKRAVPKRKTRLSTEMHPDALFEDLYDDMPEVEGESIRDDIVGGDGSLRDPDDVKQTGQLSELELLRELLEM